MVQDAVFLEKQSEALKIAYKKLKADTKDEIALHKLLIAKTASYKT